MKCSTRSRSTCRIQTRKKNVTQVKTTSWITSNYSHDIAKARRSNHIHSLEARGTILEKQEKLSTRLLISAQILIEPWAETRAQRIGLQAILRKTTLVDL
eukprot:TRINITY_DN7673_c2_g1_i1.p1 TRINITY_DN7673_c2_g1~~TRINITY_DN7673_c2_g1_i1.p1  ORF type:complete len:100 (+),score=6.39 TRINITY_DN7673_c2_g1_i1:55-354(+)